MVSSFIQSATILLREGLEALLVLAALAAYIHKAGARERLPAFYGGAGLAIVASLVVAWLFEVFNNGVHNDILEGVTILAAAALMLYVSGWLLLRQDPRAWQHFLNTKADEALARRTYIAVAALAFLAVFREGAETVLFVHALAQTQGGWSFGMIAGLVLAAVVLVGLFFAINVVARRLPLRSVFIATSFFLLVMAIRFIGDHIADRPDLPWLTWLAFGACHAPHQAPAGIIKAYDEVFAHGWDVEREQRLARQKRRQR